MTLRWSARALREAAAAHAWWSQNRPLAPDLLQQELRRALQQLEGAPLSGAPAGQFRRVILKRCRYVLFYVAVPAPGQPEQPEQHEVKIVSLWSMLRGKPPRLGGTGGP